MGWLGMGYAPLYAPIVDIYALFLPFFTPHRGSKNTP
jgi:hypothetical protein